MELSASLAIQTASTACPLQESARTVQQGSRSTESPVIPASTTLSHPEELTTALPATTLARLVITPTETAPVVSLDLDSTMPLRVVLSATPHLTLREPPLVWTAIPPATTAVRKTELALSVVLDSSLTQPPWDVTFVPPTPST